MRAVRRIKPAIVVPLELLDPLDAVARLKVASRDVRLVVVRHSAGTFGTADVRAYSKYVDMIVGVSRLITKLLELHSGIEPERIRYIPPGIHAPNQQLFRVWDHRPLRLGYVGRLDEQKRVFELADLCRELNRLDVAYRLDIFGAGPCQEDLQRQLRDETERGQVSFHGYLPNVLLHEQAYPHIDCQLLFSAVEGNPICLLEGMIHGAVPVTSRFRGCATEGIVREGVTGFTFPVGDTATAAHRIQQLDCDRTLLERLSTAARETVGEKYFVTNVNSQWIKVFEQTLELSCKIGETLPKLPEGQTPHGRLNRIGLPDYVARALRRLVGRPSMPETASDEWPYACRFHDAGALRDIDRLAESIDAGYDPILPDSL